MLKFAIFDHLDSDGGPLGQFFQNRLRLIELIEQSGFHAYHSTARVCYGPISDIRRPASSTA